MTAEARLNAWKTALKHGDDELDRGESVAYTAAALHEITHSAKKAMHGTRGTDADVLPWWPGQAVKTAQPEAM